MKRITFALMAVLLFCQATNAQPVPGDVFREYRWFHAQGDAGQAIRVGGKKGDNYPDRGSAFNTINAPVTWPFSVDLDAAIRAEIVFEKVLCHDETTGLAIQINDSDWFYVPEPVDIPAPQGKYQHHTYPVLRVPLSVFKAGTGNRFCLRVDPTHPWDWPQNLINGVHVRIYYDDQRKDHQTYVVTSIKENSRLSDSVALKVKAQNAEYISSVDYVGLYEDVNLEGDGIYRQWHYLYFHGQLKHHIGSATQAPFTVQWDTTWIPDQKEAMQISARVTDKTGLTVQTEAVGALSLQRDKRSVELCKPYDIPQKWVTRSGEKTESFDVRGDVSKIIGAQLVWSSWSPGYMQGIAINGTTVFDREGPKYQTFYHRVTLKDLSVFRSGQNTLTTGQTPRIDGNMVHGMEVNWPGIMVLIQYDE